ncbi:DUF3667 domain-containing protein [Hymenobacter lucidus]|uniref:DUF3667 domain-containing protein n=1 Tax=Hymenobacter lucidus TaxID=2880930 RepID=A0ABS8ASJ0_9BACT|nr:DUF3667 domain-containing protein [Hymenobacter lucidus]MCB2408316.1 DUF3667 domain-containing protein [Hymenobacter lucidus]
MSTSASAPCLNCGQPELTGNYCPACGQKRPHRLSVRHVLHEIVHSFTHADSTIGRYIMQVLLQPGQVVADYLAGRRKRYFNPFQFLLLVVGFAAAAAALLHYYDLTGNEMQQRYASHMAALHVARVGEYFRYVGKYYNIWWLLLLLPIYSLFTWLIYRPRGLNYAESFFVHVVIGSAFHLYLLALWLGLWALQIKVQAVNNIGNSLQVLIILLYLVLVSRQALGLRWVGAIWRATLVVVLSIMASVGLNYVAFHLYVFR